MKKSKSPLAETIIKETEAESLDRSRPEYQLLSPYPHCVLPPHYFSSGPRRGRTLVTVKRDDGSSLLSVET